MKKYIFLGVLILGLVLANHTFAVVVNGQQHTPDTTTQTYTTSNPTPSQTLQLQAAANSNGSSATALVLNSDMHFGSTDASTNGQVSMLQNFLIGQGDLTMPAGVSTGYFGSLTKAAVVEFQTAEGINPNVGYVGPITRAAIVTVTSTKASGSTGTNSNPSGNSNGTYPSGGTNSTGSTTCFTADCSRSGLASSSSNGGNNSTSTTGTTTCPSYASCGAQIGPTY